MAFRKGDRVKFIHDRTLNGLYPGATGTVLRERDTLGFVWVEWDHTHDIFHTCGGLCENKHGWGVDDYMLDYYTEDIIPINTEDIMSILI